jgi:hypothetical protein
VAHGVVVASFQAFHPETGERETKKLHNNFSLPCKIKGFRTLRNKWETELLNSAASQCGETL